MTGPKPIGGMPKRAEISWIKDLYVSRELRDSKQQHLIEGAREFLAALANGIAIEHLFVSTRLLKIPTAKQYIRDLRRAGIPYTGLSADVFRDLSQRQKASGILAVVKQHRTRLHSLSVPRNGCWLAVERINSPGNLGTLMRTSHAFGGEGIIVLCPQTDPFNPQVVRASMGSIFGQKIVCAGKRNFKHWLERHRLPLIGASPSAKTSIRTYRFKRPCVLMLGEERKGLDATQLDLCTNTVSIPMGRNVDSLNVGIAGSLLLYEVFRDSQY